MNTEEHQQKMNVGLWHWKTQRLSCGSVNAAWNNVNRKQYIFSHGNFEGIDELMCNSFKIKSLLYKLPLDRAASKDGIFAEHIFCADSSVCNHLNTAYSMCV